MLTFLIMVWQNYRGNKYKAKRAEYKGRSYHSIKEAEDAMWLDDLLKKGEIKEVKPQHRIRFFINDKHLWDHLVDFLITLPDGRQKYVETKGFPTSEWAKNKKLAEALYPEIPYLVNPNEKELLK